MHVHDQAMILRDHGAERAWVPRQDHRSRFGTLREPSAPPSGSFADASTAVGTRDARRARARLGPVLATSASPAALAGSSVIDDGWRFDPPPDARTAMRDFIDADSIAVERRGSASGGDPPRTERARDPDTSARRPLELARRGRIEKHQIPRAPPTAPRRQRSPTNSERLGSGRGPRWRAGTFQRFPAVNHPENRDDAGHVRRRSVPRVPASGVIRPRTLRTPPDSTVAADPR
jgi:hypothetical protein